MTLRQHLEGTGTNCYLQMQLLEMWDLVAVSRQFFDRKEDRIGSRINKSSVIAVEDTYNSQSVLRCNS